jgi:hypothetical protein
MLFSGMASSNTGKAFIRPFLIISFLYVFFYLPASGQTVELPLNGEGKVEYFRIVESDSLDYFTLWENATSFLNSLTVPDQLTKNVQTNEEFTELKHQFGFYLFVKPTLTKQIDGVIIADISMAVEDNTYQYQINNFKFVKYARNRFGQFVPTSSKTYPLELYYPDSRKKSWKAHFGEINTKMSLMQLKLEDKMMELQ